MRSKRFTAVLAIAFIGACKILLAAPGPVFPDGPAERNIDLFEPGAPAYNASVPAAAHGKLSTEDLQASCGGRALRLDFGVGCAAAAALNWSADPTWSECEGLVFWVRMPPGTGAKAFRFFVLVELRDSSGGDFSRRYEIPRQALEGEWQPCRLSFREQAWTQPKGKIPVAAPAAKIARVQFSIGGRKDAPLSVSLAGIGLYQPWNGARLSIDEQATPEYAGSIVNPDAFTRGMAPGEDQVFRFKVKAENLFAGQTAEVKTTAADFWGQANQEQTLALRGAATGPQTADVEIRIPSNAPGLLKLNAALSVAGQPVYSGEWTMMSRFKLGAGRLGYLAEKIRRKENVTVAYIGGSITAPWTGHFSSSQSLRRIVLRNGAEYRMLNFG